MTTPTHEDLQDFLTGNLSGELAVEIERELDRDEGLAAKVGTQIDRDDTIVSALKRPVPVEAGFENDTAYRRGLDLVMAIGRSWSQVDGTSAAATPGEDLGAIRDYRLLEKLGEGGMGTVYKAVQTRLEKVVALKLLPADRLQDPAAVARFEREMKAVGRLDHPNIVRATDAGEHDGRHFLVMEYVDGVDLAERVRRSGPLPVCEALDIVRQTAAGLHYAHERGLVHRDIKPSNLMVKGESRDRTDSRLSVKILDLGLARLDGENAADAETQSNLTMQGTTMGTVDFMSPEQAIDTHAADARSDVYSLGCTLFYLLTGRTPYNGKTVMERLVAHREQPIPSLGGNEQLQSLFAKMVAKDPASRFQSMADVIAAVDAIDLSACDASVLPAGGDRTEWVNDSAPTVPSTMALTDAEPPRTAAQPAARRPVARRTKWIAWSTAATVMLGAVIYISFNKHRWMIETSGKGVEVTTKDGDVSVRDAQTGTVVKIDKDGNTSVNTRGDRNKVKIGDNEFEITRDGKVIAKGVKTLMMARGAPRGAKGGRVESFRLRNYALKFDGKDDYVEVPSLKYDGKGPLTVEAFCRVDDLKRSTLVQLGSDNAAQLSLHLDGTSQWTAEKGAGSSSVTQRGTQQARPGPRVHVAAVWDGKRLWLFVNGVPQPGGNLTRKRATASDMQKTVIGAVLTRAGGKSSAGSPFGGSIDALRISTAALYTAKFVPPQRLQTGKSTLALYDFNAGRGSKLVDGSGHNHHGVIHGATWVNADGSPILPAHWEKDNFALHFDGKDDYVQLPETFGNFDKKSITIEAWVVADKDGPRLPTIAQLDGFKLRLVRDSPVWMFLAYGPPPVVTLTGSGRAAVFGKRTHLAGVCDGKRIGLFVNGRFASYRPHKKGFRLVEFVKENFIGAAGKADAKSQFKGVIDEVRISKVVRYTKDFQPQLRFKADKDTLALYHCDEADGDVLRDSSGHNRHGKIAGASWVKQVAADRFVADDADRKLAEWVLAHGGELGCVSDGKPATIRSERRLPHSPFLVAAVAFNNRPKLQDAQLKELAGLLRPIANDQRYLYGLVLTGTGITDSGLAHLKGLAIKVVNLGNTKVGDDGVRHLAGVRQLTEVGLMGTSVSDAGLAHLHPVATLRKLAVGNTRVTKGGIAKLKKALPKCAVDRDAPRSQPEAAATRRGARGNAAIGSSNER